MRTDSGANGYRSDSHRQAQQREWVQVDLAAAHPIDEIVLVPMIRRGTATGFQADGFPTAFEVIAGKQDEPEGTLIARFTADDPLLPRAAPVVIPCPGLRASWVRIVATELGRRAVDDLYVLQLSELMLFSQGRNLALKQTVSASSCPALPSADFSAIVKSLVDGFVPYLVDNASGPQRQAQL